MDADVGLAENGRLLGIERGDGDRPAWFAAEICELKATAINTAREQDRGAGCGCGDGSAKLVCVANLRRSVGGEGSVSQCEYNAGDEEDHRSH